MSFNSSPLVRGNFWSSFFLVLWTFHLLLYEDQYLKTKDGFQSLFLISTTSLGTTALILAFLVSLRINESSPKISPDSILPTFFPSTSAINPPEITRKAVSPSSPSLTIY